MLYLLGCKNVITLFILNCAVSFHFIYVTKGFKMHLSRYEIKSCLFLFINTKSFEF